VAAGVILTGFLRREVKVYWPGIGAGDVRVAVWGWTRQGSTLKRELLRGQTWAAREKESAGVRCWGAFFGGKSYFWGFFCFGAA